MDGKTIDAMRRISLFILLLVPLIVHAEHLFEMGIHGGMAGWSAKPVYVNAQIGFNGGAQLYYNYLSPYVIGFRTGFTIDCHNAGFGKINYEDHYSTIDVQNEHIDIDYTIDDLRERYTTWSVGIPLQLALSEKNFLFLLGAKAVFPMSTKWQQTLEHAALSVYYPAYKNRVYDSYPLAASQDFAMSQNGKLQLPKIQWWLATELNYTIPLNSWARNYRSYLIVGLYFDYCLTRYMPSQSDAESMIMLTDTRDGFPLQRILTPIMNANRQNNKLIKDFAFFDVGLKISYAISSYNSSNRKSRSCHCY